MANSTAQAMAQATVNDPAPDTTIDRYRLPPLTPLALILELLIVLGMAFGMTSQYTNSPADTQLDGGEAEWLTSSAHFAAQSLQRLGYISTWQPFLEFGEPLIDSPFSFVLQPITAGPSLLYGGVTGIKLSVLWTAVAAGLGGWVLGRIMGFSWLGRILLGLLLVGKGNMHAMIGTGYYQLGVAQAYFPWILAGTIATLRSRGNRWPMAVLAVSFTLMFFAGNIWYTLPMLIAMGLLTLTHTFSIQSGKFDLVGVRRMVFAGVLTFGMSAIIFLPVWIQRDRIGNHPDDRNAGISVDINRVIEQYFNGDVELYRQGYAPGEPQFYYSFISPLWFTVLMFAILPPIRPFLYRPAMPKMWKIWAVGIFMVVFATVWGAGGNPIFVWLYNNIPLLGQWRFVGRALAIASFFIGVLLVMRVDGLWRAVALTPTWREWIWPGAPIIGRLIRLVFMVAIVATSLFAANEVNRWWKTFALPGRAYTGEAICARWMRTTWPDRPLSVWTLNYRTVTTFLNNDIRLTNIAADFAMVPDRSPLFSGNLLASLPEFGIAWESSSRAYLTENGYAPMLDSPTPVDENHCVWRKPDALPYAYAVQVETLGQYAEMLPRDAVQPIDAVERLYDRVAVVAQSNPAGEVVVTIQENAFPGWQVLVDGKRAKLEPIGGQVGVILPPGTLAHVITFQFVPPWLFVGGALTLLTLLFTMGYLARLERIVPQHVRTRLATQSEAVARVAVTRTVKFMTDSALFETKDDRAAREETKLLASQATSAPQTNEPVVPAIEITHPAETGTTQAQDGHQPIVRQPIRHEVIEGEIILESPESPDKPTSGPTEPTTQE